MDNHPTWLPPIDTVTSSPTQQLRVGHGVPIAVTPLHDAVLEAKNEIDRIAPAGQWDDAKKITNSYEYIFLSLQRRMNRSISAIQPLSRSFFKMIELWETLNMTTSAAIRTAHTAEGPGGFLEAIQYRTGHHTPMTAMTLRSTERTIPGWRKSSAFLQAHPDLTISYGTDNTGNLYHAANQTAFAQTATAGGPVDIYTADGGFDFSADFNGQENTVQRLLAAEALAGLNTLAISDNSMLIMKVFDTSTRATLDLLWVLSSCFTNTALVKPHTSRPANSERYWVGRGFRGAPAWITQLLLTMATTEAPTGWIQLFAEPPWKTRDDGWLKSILAFQLKLETVQLQAIQETLALIRAPSRERIRSHLQRNIDCSRAWCYHYGIPENPTYAGLTNAAIAALNLEEALVPFPASVARTHSPEQSRPRPTHHVSTATPPPLPPAGAAWRSAVPLSVLGRTPSQKALESDPSSELGPYHS